MEDSQGPLLLSSEQSDILQASSLELSPSNSSGGTYMWDEDGLEAFVGAGMHPCDNNDDSELNSMVSLSCERKTLQCKFNLGRIYAFFILVKVLETAYECIIESVQLQYNKSNYIFIT